MILSQEVFVQNVTSVIFCRKPWVGLGHMANIMATWIPWASVNEYIHKIKNNNDAPCQWVIWQFDSLEKKQRPNIHSHMGHI
jgi:hypothetical protein